MQNEPLYISMRKYLLEIIEQNKHTPDFKLPSENQLALRFNASRISAKNAILSLEKDGLIYRKQGKGTFIAPKASEFELLKADKQNPMICFIVPGVGGKFIGKILEGLQTFTLEHHLNLSIMVTGGDQKIEEEMIRVATQNNCKGLIIYPVDNNVYNKEILKLSLNNFPVVLVDRYLTGLDLSYVACDHFTAAYNGTKYLIDNGHTHIGFLSQDPHSVSSVLERSNGYQKALLDHIGSFDTNLQLTIDHTDPDFLETVYTYLQDNPSLTALITTSIGYGLNLVPYLQQKGIHIPEDLTLMLFDNEFEGYLPLLSFKPIIIDQNPYEIGLKVGEVLYRLLYRNPKPKKILLKESILY
ncbi:GntR family transcriptional regulator [Niameybacter massiliensis]|uniref:GntR family transcriptional regulator n=1 Tax=Niameybacter massiliensis TaxID=1658108 RepID=UPI0006B58897|nr:GntR family transcriptional regulator [Niameybacter massiliensis]